MRQKLANYIKYNKKVYSAYYYTVSFCINALKIFVRTDDKLIFFNSFAGRKYDDSPRAIFEKIKEDARFRDYRFVWAFHNPKQFDVDGAKKIQTDSVRYFITALKARVWVTNSSIERGLNFKKKKTFYLNTWHGSPIKKMGSDIRDNNQSFGSRGKNSIDIMNVQSQYEGDIFSTCFNIPRNRFLEVGLPRNDELCTRNTVENRCMLKEKIGLPLDKQVILYCPTYREYIKESNYGVLCAPPINFKNLENELKDNYVFLFRSHYEVSKTMGIEFNDFVRDVTDYKVINELMIASDVLISDYSSIFFDYSVMDKPMLYFTYDYQEYDLKRGMYFDIRKLLNGADNELDIINILKKIDIDSEVQRTRCFREKYVEFYGDATQKTIDCIATNIM